MDKLIEETINNFIEDGISFTALDVTKEVNKTQYVRHFECRGVTNRYMTDYLSNNDVWPEYTYKVKTIDVTLPDGQTAKAKLYYNVASTPEQYTNRNQTFGGTEELTPSPIVDPDPVPAVDPDPILTPIPPTLNNSPVVSANNFMNNVLKNIADAKTKFSI